MTPCTTAEEAGAKPKRRKPAPVRKGGYVVRYECGARSAEEAEAGEREFARAILRAVRRTG